MSSSSWSPLPGLSVTLPEASWDILLQVYSSLAAGVLTVNQQLDDLVSSQTLSPGRLPGTGAFTWQSNQHRGFGATIRWLGDFGQVMCSLRVWVVVVREGLDCREGTRLRAFYLLGKEETLEVWKQEMPS